LERPKQGSSYTIRLWNSGTSYLLSSCFPDSAGIKALEAKGDLSNSLRPKVGDEASSVPLELVRDGESSGRGKSELPKLPLLLKSPDVELLGEDVPMGES
jgi:hypothetical protein